MDSSVQPPPDGAPSLRVSALTRGLTRGDESAYREFHAHYFHRLYRYLLVVAAGDEHAARDALQETYRRVVRYIRIFDTEPAFWGWLTVLARSAWRDHHRRRRRYLAFLDRFTRHVETDVPAPPVETDTLLAASLAQGLARLAPDERDLLTWKYTGGESVRAIAARLGLTEKAVEGRLARLRLKLKAHVLDALSHESPP